MILVPVDELRKRLKDLRGEVSTLEDFGAQEAAEAGQVVLQRLERHLQDLENEKLTPAQAAEEVGIEPDTARKKIGRDWPNVGEKGSPRTLRRHLYEDHPDHPNLADKSSPEDRVDEIVGDVE